MAEALAALDFLPPLRLQVNNRKLIEGFYRGLGAPDTAAVMRAIDKLDKVPADVDRHAAARRGRAGRRAGRAVPARWPRSAAADTSFVERVRALGVAARTARRRDWPSSPP